MPRRRPVPVVLAALLLFAAAATAHAQTASATAPEAIYRLAPASGFEEGCFDPCLCPVHFTDGLLGTMVLASAAPEPGYAVFDVRQVNWFVPVLGHWVTGAGTYRVGHGAVPVHRLTLDLQVGDRPVQRFDSGLVPLPPSPSALRPAIDISITMNNRVCHDTVFHLVAAPITLQEIAPYALYRSHYDEGCFGPCDCPVTARPMAGRFGLLKLGAGPAWADYAVLGFRALVRATGALSTAAGTPVEGFGIYRVGAPAGDQRLRLALVEDGRGPTRFDSGLVPGDGNLRRIDIDVAGNGFACYDRVYSIDARRRPATVMNFQIIAPDPVAPVVAPAP